MLLFMQCFRQNSCLYLFIISRNTSAVDGGVYVIPFAPAEMV